MIDLLYKGYSTPLENHDLGELPEEETTRRQFDKFREVYEKHRVIFEYQKNIFLMNGTRDEILIKYSNISWKSFMDK